MIKISVVAALLSIRLVGQQQLQQKNLLKQVVVVAGDQINHRALASGLDGEAFEIFDDQRALDSQQLCAAQFAAELDRFSIDNRQARGKNS